jgi:hypothetical protein
MSMNRRLDKLEARLDADEAPAWRVVDAALTRQTARIRLVVGERLGTAADHVVMIAARETLGVDTCEREAADLEVIHRWRRVHPTPEPPGDVRQRLLDKIEQIASRLAATHAITHHCEPSEQH